MSQPIAHLFPNGQVERGTAKKPRDKPGYRWVPAYSQIRANGCESMPLPRRDWYALGARDGFKCKFHASREAARAAFDNATR
jgi:hypothetical protein